MNAGDFGSARAALYQAHALGRRIPAGSARQGYRLGAILETLGPCRTTWECLSQVADANERNLPDWRGQSLRVQDLVIEKRIRDIGADLRMGRLIEIAASAARSAVAYVEPRLVPLFRRSFVNAEVCSVPASKIPITGSCLASYEILARWLAPDADSIRRQFVPLCADPTLAGRIRRFYRHHAAGSPTIGLSWHSTNTNKDLPGIADWEAFVAHLPAQFVSINYGDRAADLEQLSRAAQRPVLADQVDQLASLDDMAAQIDAVDQVVTVSNSTAHMAGSMGKTVYILDTSFNGATWPAAGSRSPWYPRGRIVRKSGSWIATLRALADQIAPTL